MSNRCLSSVDLLVHRSLSRDCDKFHPLFSKSLFVSCVVASPSKDSTLSLV